MFTVEFIVRAINQKALPSLFKVMVDRLSRLFAPGTQSSSSQITKLTDMVHHCMDFRRYVNSQIQICFCELLNLQFIIFCKVEPIVSCYTSLKVLNAFANFITLLLPGPKRSSSSTFFKSFLLSFPSNLPPWYSVF